jgi:transcriptional regulator with XRE-family HTH domain
MLKPNLLRAARALLKWEQADLARHAGVSIATIRKIEQGAASMREVTANKLVSALDEAGLQLFDNDAEGGIGARFKEPEMTENMQAFMNLKNKVKGWFVYNLDHVDNDDLDALIDELAFDADDGELEQHRELGLPEKVIADLKKLNDLEMDIGIERDERMLSSARDAGWDGDPETLEAFVAPENDDDEGRL